MTASRAGGPSLKARAISLLSRREHSRAELRQKLARHGDDAAQIEAVLDQLAADGWQSDERYAQAFARRQSQKRGTAWIAHSLRSQGVDDTLVGDIAASLGETESARAHAVWQHKFGSPPVDARQYARQYRFLASRGFSPDTVRQVLRGSADPDGDAP